MKTKKHRWGVLTMAVLLMLPLASILTGCGPQAGRAANSDPTDEEGPVAQKIAVTDPDMDMLEQRLQAYLSQQIGTYGVYVMDLVSGETAGINSDQVVAAASTFKVPLVLYVLKQVELGKVSLDEVVAYQDSDFEPGTGTLQDYITEGDTVSIRRLVELAIVESDNIATNMLVRRFGYGNMLAYIRQELGGTVNRYGVDYRGTTPKEMSMYMQQLYDGTALNDAGLQEWLLDVLANTSFKDRTEAGVPAGIKVSHKIGTLGDVPNVGDVVNDVAVVHLPGRPFIIAVFGMGVDLQDGANVIAELTRLVFEYELSLIPRSVPAEGWTRQQ